tara:strand:+ start:114 stop:605 length:492 start_codon:yes stop_codon:yes gene_type:complete
MKNKIYILGSVGSGKTTLAKKISNKLKIPLFELDDVYWKKKYTIKRGESEKRKELSKILGKHKKWIIEGASGSFVGKAVKQADLVIWLDLHHRLLSFRIIKRSFREMLKGEQSFSGMRRLLSEIKDYKNRNGMYKKHRKLLRGNKKYVVLRSRGDIKKLLDEL